MLEYMEDLGRPVKTALGQKNRRLLDVCCGTGQLARHFLDNGWTVTGIDLSEHMLRVAQKNVGQHYAAGRARLLQADATAFSVEREFGLATATFDATQVKANASLDSIAPRFARPLRR